MKKIASKKGKTSADDKAHISRMVDEIVGECSTLPDTISLVSKIRELERSNADYTAVLSKKFSKSTIAQQEFIINHLLPHLKKFSLSGNLNNLAQKETLTPRIIIDILHYLIRSDAIVDHHLLEQANQAEELVTQFSTLVENNVPLESQEGATLFDKFCDSTLSLQLGILMELLHLKGEKCKSLLLKILNTKAKISHKVIEYLGSLTDKNSVSLLSCLLNEVHDKELSKSIKKTLYRLKNKGIEVSSSEPVTPAPPEKKKVSLPSPTSYATSIDPLGERLMIAVKPTSEQEVTIFQFLTSDQKGINDLIVSLSTPKEWNNHLTKLQNTKGITLVEIDLPYCIFLIKESTQKNHESGTRIPESYFLWKKFSNEIGDSLESAMIYRILNAEEIRSQESLLGKSPGLLKERELTLWLLEWRFLLDSYRELYDAEHSTLVLAEYQKEQRVSEIVNKTTRQFFDDKNRLVFQRRLEETAYILWKRGNVEDAKAALAAALAFAPQGVPSEKHPFALKTVEENFKFLKEQTQKEKRSDSGRIILP